MTKFRYLKFPIFGLKDYIKLEYTLDKIYAHKENQKYIIDDKTIPNHSYLSRLIELDSRKDYQRLKFDFTIRNIEELLKSKCKLGIDDSGVIHNFTIRERVRYAEKRIVKIKDNYIWFKNISYPFKIPSEMIKEVIKNREYYYGQLVYIVNTWYFLQFTDEKSNKEMIWI
jgi:hypothetical protein